MTEFKTYTCIVCPEGCTLQIDEAGAVTGNKCRRGENYARSESVDPRRNIASTVKVIGGTVPVVSVKTDAPIPKGLIFDCMAAVKSAVVQAPVYPGDRILANVCNTGVNIVATGKADKAPEPPLFVQD